MYCMKIILNLTRSISELHTYFWFSHTAYISVTRREVVLTSVDHYRSYQNICTRSLYSSRIAEAAPFSVSFSQFFENNNTPEVFFIILHYIRSRLVTLLKVIDAPTQVPNICYLTVSFKFLNFSFQICLLFVPEVLSTLSLISWYILSFPIVSLKIFLCPILRQ
jgi:hypothetical protein